MKKISNKNISNYFIYSPLIIFVSILFMSIGYATVNSVDLFIEGSGTAMEQTGLFISEAVYASDTNNASVSNSSVKLVSGTVLHSQISLSSLSTDTNSSITYKVTIYNANNYNCRFVEAIFDSSFYDNTNITFEISDELNTDVVLEPTDSVIFYITFKYVNGVTPSSAINTLDAYVNFQFDLEPTVVASLSYTGSSQTFVVPRDGNYKIELWGASGDNHYNDYVAEVPAYGGYTSGEINLLQDETIYVYVGGKNQIFNMASKKGNRGGGGATDIRLINGDWDNFDSLASRIMVAGGSGGNYIDSSATRGGHAGGLKSTAVIKSDGSIHNIGQATQTTGAPAMYKGTAGTFGMGGINSESAYNSGGGGYYGGGGGAASGGGSSFISGHAGCVAVTESSTVDNIIQRNDSNGNICLDDTTDITCSYHYSNYIFNNTIMIDGGGYIWTTEKSENSTGMPTHDGSATMTGNDGNGYAKITLIDIN